MNLYMVSLEIFDFFWLLLCLLACQGAQDKDDSLKLEKIHVLNQEWTDPCDVTCRIYACWFYD